MLKLKQIFFHIKRKSMTDVYISGWEMEDLIANLTTTELRLFTKLHNSVLINPSVDYYEETNLAKELNLAVSSIKNAKTALKQKGYAIIVKFKDEQGKPCLRVIVGKDQVTLYNLGINVEITDAKEFQKMLKKYPITDPSLTIEQREEMVKQINQEYLQEL